MNLLCPSTVNGKKNLTDSNRAEPYVTSESYLVADLEERGCNAAYFDRSPPTFRRKVLNPSVCGLLIFDVLLCLLLDSDDGNDIFLRNIGGHLPNYTALRPVRSFILLIVSAVRTCNPVPVGTATDVRGCELASAGLVQDLGTLL